ILARYVDTTVVPTRYSGEITSIDNKNFQFTMMTIDQKSQNIDIETTSTIYSYTSGGSLTRYGFSKLTVGDRVEVIGYPDKKDATLLVTDRAVDYLSAPKDAKISIVTPTTAATVAPTSAGAK